MKWFTQHYAHAQCVLLERWMLFVCPQASSISYISLQLYCLFMLQTVSLIQERQKGCSLITMCEIFQKAYADGHPGNRLVHWLSCASLP